MSEPAAPLPQFHVVGFSGHRLLEEPAAVAQAIRETLAALQRESPGEWVALSSIAAGADAAFARAALEAGLAWHVVLPLPPSEFRQDFSPDEWRQVEALLAEAEQVRVVSEAGSREDAYLDGGVETVNGCDVLLAVWDGGPARGRGGTADVVAYARAIRQPLILIDARTRAVRRENFERFAAPDRHLAFFNALPDAPAAGTPPAFPALAPTVRFQHKADFAASREAPHLRRMVAGTVLLHVLATLVAAAGLAFGWHFVALPWLKLVCLLGALGVALVVRHADAHHTWVRCRLAAELARSALATWGLPRGAPLFDQLDLPDYRALMRSLHLLHRRASATRTTSLADFKAAYLRDRVDDQLAYYRHKLASALPLLSRLRFGFWAATGLAIACTAAYALAHTLHWSAFPPRAEQIVFHFLPISLPVVAAAFISLISIHDLHRRVARYREMVHRLEAARSQIAFCQTWNSVERIVQKTERALVQEVLEWHSITSFTESH